jgi:CRP-like cAMP-binding protein
MPMTKNKGVFVSVRGQPFIDLRRFLPGSIVQKSSFRYRKGDLVFTQGELADTISYISDCVIVTVKQPTLTKLLQDNPRFSKLFVSYLARRNSQIEANLADQLLNSSEKRLARRLLLIAQSTPRRSFDSARINQHALAEIIGTTQSRISYFISKFRRLRLIEYNGQLKINKPLLESFLDE